MSRFRFFFLFQFAHVPERFHFYAGRKKSLREKKEGIHVMEERMSLQLTSPPPLPEKKKHFWVWGGGRLFWAALLFYKVFFSFAAFEGSLTHKHTFSSFSHAPSPPKKEKEAHPQFRAHKSPVPSFPNSKNYRRVTCPNERVSGRHLDECARLPAYYHLVKDLDQSMDVQFSGGRGRGGKMPDGTIGQFMEHAFFPTFACVR